MTLLLSPDNHYCLDFSDQVKSICTPLFKNTAITEFLYIRLYKNGSRLQLGTHPKWLKHYIDNDYCKETLLTFDFDVEINKYLLYSCCMDNPVFNQAVNAFNMQNGIVLSNKLPDSIEFFHFASDKEDTKLLHFYINNMDCLERFIIYFKDAAKEILDCIKPYTLSKEALSSICKGVRSGHLDKLLDEDNYLESTKAGSFDIIVGDQHVQLKAIEACCLHAYLHGLTAKEIATVICRSNRTVEFYLKNIKKALGCRNRSDVFQLLVDSDQFDKIYQYKFK